MEAGNGYCDIEDYGLIGDVNSAALVSKYGSIDWLCFPRFDSPSVFAALLDPEIGGRFAVCVEGEHEAHQAYIEDTNVLRTLLKTGDGSLEVVDYMPCYLKNEELEAFHEVHRRLRCMGGSVKAKILYQPRFGYGLGHTRLQVEDEGCLAQGLKEWLSLATDLPLRAGDGTCTAEEDLRGGDERWMVLRWNDDYLRPLEEFLPAEKLEKTVAFWRDWVNRCAFTGPLTPLVKRSMLALKLMTYEPTGAIIAAPTTSLPEIPKGTKNWDYRYSWLRDSAFVLSAFHTCGYTEEERRFRHWIIRRLRGHTLDPENLQIMYGVEGDSVLEEKVLSHLRGYRGAKPVRSGNAAYSQFQLDVYGSVIDALHFSYHTEEDMNDDLWRTVEALANFVAANWERPDSGIWELREVERNYVYSDVMAWVAMDRAVKIAQRWGNRRRAELWAKVRDEIREKVLQEGFDEELGSFVMYYGGREVDGSVLVMPLVGFLPGDDPRFLGSLERIRQELGNGPLVNRFREKGAREGAFLMLSFWMVDGLVAAGRLKEAREAFEEIVGYANHLGLFAEMLDPETKSFLGNFPQAFTHMALVNSAKKLMTAEGLGQ
ncbi:MAG: glycoside hydrolase family 15 protein [Thermoplasmata archaeon]